MKKSQRQQLLFGVVMVLGLILTACGGSSIVGKWQATDESLGASVTLEFKSNGELEMSIPDLLTVEGTWKKIDADTFEMTISALGQEQTTQADFSVSGNTLTITSEGQSQELTRVQ